MSKHIPKAKGADTASSILSAAFGDKYYGLISLPSANILLNAQEKKKLESLIAERDHYEIKQTIKKLKVRC